jgi:hypothetical protein
MARVRGLTASIAIGLLLALVPAATAEGQARSSGATASAGFVRLGGADRLPARRKLRVPLRCAVVCRITTRAVLVLPGPNLGPLVSTTTLTPGYPKDLVLTLNGPATQTLKQNVGLARLKVRAHAVNTNTGAVADAFRVFRFKL